MRFHCRFVLQIWYHELVCIGMYKYGGYCQLLGALEHLSMLTFWFWIVSIHLFSNFKSFWLFNIHAWRDGLCSGLKLVWAVLCWRYVAHMMWAHDGGPTSAWCTPRWPGSPHCQPLFEAASVHSQLRHPGRGGVRLLTHKYNYKCQIIVQCIHAIKSEKASRILSASYFA